MEIISDINVNVGASLVVMNHIFIMDVFFNFEIGTYFKNIPSK